MGDEGKRGERGELGALPRGRRGWGLQGRKGYNHWARMEKVQRRLEVGMKGEWSVCWMIFSV